MSRARREPLSDEHRVLGGVLREARLQVRATTRDVAHYSSGHISNVENGHVTPSHELVQHYIVEFGCDREAALAAYGHMRDTSEARRREQRLARRGNGVTTVRVTPESTFSEIRDCYRVDGNEASYFFDEQGALRKVTVIRTVSAVRPGVSLVTARYSYHSDPRQGILSIEAGSNCRIERVHETVTGYLSAVLRLDREISPREPDPYTLSFTIRVDSDRIAVPRLRYHGQSNTRYALRVYFTQPLLPAQLWWFREPDVFDAEHAPASDRLLSSANGFYFNDFHNLSNEHAGIAWEWDG